MNKKQTAISIAVTLLIALPALIVGVLLGNFLPSDALAVMSTVALVSFFVLLVATVAGFIATLIMKKERRVRLAPQIEKLEAVKKNAEKNYPALRRSMTFATVLGDIYYAILLILDVLVILGLPATGEIESFSVYLITAYLLYGLVSFSVGQPKAEMPEFKLTREEYPEVCSVIDSTAAIFGLEGQVEAYLFPNVSCGITRIGKRYVLSVGSLALNMWTKEEFRQVLIHEYAHVKNGDLKISSRFDRVVSKYEREFDNFTVWAVMAMRLPMILIEKKWSYFRLGSSFAGEIRADRAIKTYGDPETFANGLSKLEVFSLYADEPADAPCFFEEVKYPEHRMRTSLSLFYGEVEARADIYRKLLDSSIPAKFESHPIFKERMSTVGATSYDFETREPEDSLFFAEQQKILDFTDAKLKELADEVEYAEYRKHNYLEPLERLEEFERADKAQRVTDPAILVDAANNYELILRFSEAERIYERMLELNPKSAQALFGLGKRKLFWYYDKSGIEDIYRAMDDNSNYIQEGFELIGRFCCLMGLEEEREIYRERVVGKMEESINEWDGFSSISKRDKLTSTILKPETVEAVVERAKQKFGDMLGSIYIVHKTVSEAVAGDIVCIRPRVAVEDVDSWNTAMRGLFHFLDTFSDEQIGLYDLDRDPATCALLCEIDGSLIYESREGFDK